MIDSVGNNTNVTATQRAQQAAQTQSVRNPQTLTAVQQTQQKKSNATAPVKIFAVPQTGKSGTTGTAKLPRGSLVDELV